MYDLSAIMTRAWVIFRKTNVITFAECLHRAWQVEKSIPVNSQRIADAKAAAGIVEDIDTWHGWTTRGFEVVHGSKCLFQADLIQASKGDSAKPYRASFFSFSQVRPCMTA